VRPDPGLHAVPHRVRWPGILSRDVPPSVDAQPVASDELVRALIATTPGGIVRVAADGRVVDANAQACQILGLHLDALSRTWIADFDTKVLDEQGCAAPVETFPVSITLTTGKSAGPRTLGVQRPDGSVSWAVYHSMPLAAADGMLAGALVTLLDITDRVRIESALRQGEERWRSLVQNLPDFVITLDRQGYLQAINRTVPDLDAATVIGRHFSEYMPPESAAAQWQKIQHVLATGETGTFETLGQGAAGRTEWYETVLAPLQRDGKIDGVIVISRNIENRKRLEMELARSQRLASIGMLAAGIAHEINNPLTYILASIDHAMERARDAESLTAMAEARSGAERVRAIVADLKLLSREGDDGDGPSDLGKVVDAALGIVDSELRHSATLVRDDTPLPPVVGSEGRLVQVALNLLVNAVHAFEDSDPSRNSIRVATRLADGGRMAELVVEDDGAGIAAEDLPRIFDPFFTTKSPGKGTGLGLAICHSIVTSLGGTVEADSAPGRGTRIHVRLPLADRPISDPPAPPVPQPSHRRRVLVVDDDVAVARALGRMLGDVHDVTLAHDGADALAMLEQQAFDLVLCDVMMPRVTGIDVYERVRAQRAAIADRFVLVTGGVFSADLRARMEAHGVPCLYKPFDRATLLALVERILAR